MTVRMAPSRRPRTEAPPEPRRIAYVVSRFPVATETFILRELDQVAARPDLEVELFSLFPGERSCVHPAGERWLARLHRSRALDPVAGPVWWLARRPVRMTGATLWVLCSYASHPSVLVRAMFTVGVAAAHARRVERLGVDHVHAHWATYPALAAWVGWRLTGIPYSFTGHAHDLFVHQLGLRRKLRDARFAVVISRYNERLVESLGADPARVHVVHCGIDLAAYRFRPRAPAPTGRVRAICVASFNEFKGHRVLIDALAVGGPQIDRLDVDLVGEGPLREEVRALALRRGVEGRLAFVGRLSEQDVARRLDAADLAVLPSVVARNGDTEGIPNALMEAMASGVPVVSTRLSGIPELVRDGETGLLAEPADAGSLRAAIERTLADPRAAYERALAGRRLVEREFDIRRIAERLAALFREGAG
jgi:colanic acid/amylovoran biosynthesis glycosyltransferase